MFGRFIGLIFTLIGLIFVGIGGAITYSTYTFMSNSVNTTGQVLSVAINTSDGSTTYQPTFTYVDLEGQQQQGTTSLSSSDYDFSVGEKMEILYDQRNFSNVRLANWFGTWGFGIIFMAAGVVPLLIGRFIRKLSKRGSRKRAFAGDTETREKYRHSVAPDAGEDHSREPKREFGVKPK